MRGAREIAKEAKLAGAVLLGAALLGYSVVATKASAAGQAVQARRGADDDGARADGERRRGREGVDTTPPGVAPDASAKALFESKCSICHPLSRPLSRNRDRKHWTEDVTRMQKVNDCPVTDEEVRRIIDYLVVIRGPLPKRGR